MLITKICLRCGQNFSAPHYKTNQIYCSKQCKDGQRIEKSCVECNKIFFVPPCRERIKYCSLSCKNKKTEKKCKTCGEMFLLSPSLAFVLKNCDKCKKGKREKIRIKSEINAVKELKKKEQKNNRETRPQIKKKEQHKDCKRCGKVFHSKNIRRKYCSTDCIKNQIHKVCKRCGKNFSVIPSLAQAKFCSKICYRPPIHKKCEKCSSDFQVSPRDASQRFCSVDCYIKSIPTGANNPKKSANSGKKRLQAIKAAQGSYSEKQWTEKIEYYGHKCYLCGTFLVKGETHREHRKPISRGGTNWIANIAPACAKCNLKKNSMTEKEFRAQMAHQNSA